MIKSFAVLTAACASMWAQPSFEGNWQGSLAAGPAKLRLVVHITRTAQGQYASTLDSIDQGAMGIPVSKTAVAGSGGHLDIAALRAAYDGTLAAAGASVEGKFTHAA